MLNKQASSSIFRKPTLFLFITAPHFFFLWCPSLSLPQDENQGRPARLPDTFLAPTLSQFSNGCVQVCGITQTFQRCSKGRLLPPPAGAWSRERECVVGLLLPTYASVWLTEDSEPRRAQ